MLRLLEIWLRKGGNPNAVIPLHSIVATVIVLGLFLSILFDVLFAIVIVAKKILRQPINISSFILYFNLIMLPIEIWYNFIWKTGA
jgi:hypothetical protein